MADQPFIARGFHGRRASAPSGRLPPGQYETRDFPVLSAGPTPRTPLAAWDFTIRSADDGRSSVRWSWDEFQALPRETPTVDIHCVTKWSKFDTKWEGVSVDTLLEVARAARRRRGGVRRRVLRRGLHHQPAARRRDRGKAWVAFGYDGAPLPPEHGGPARLLVPHLYFWKSAKWVRGLQLLPADESGFWEQLGYHNRGDPWREQRYQGDP